jgi:peptidoglycan/xylan/chitin deacetylase (PgdA/CDA1 family)
MEPGSRGPFPNLPIGRRRHFAWPEGNRLALWVVPNLEYFHLDAALPGIHNERVPPGSARIPDVRSWSIREYGNRVGVWRIVDVLSRYGIRGTAALNSDLCDFHPEIIATAVELGWELMGHCQTNALRLNEMPPDQERAAIHATLERIAAATGTRPKGWLGAGVAETWNTLDFLVAEGVRYVADWTCDDLPFRMKLGDATIFSIPYTLQASDSCQCYNQKATADEFERVLVRQFDWLYRESEHAPRVMAISIHPFIAGVPHWIGALDAALEHICSHAGVWRATGSEIVDHFALMVEDE